MKERRKMCLGIPAEVKEVRDDGTALIESGSVQTVVSLALIDAVKPGDYVIVHAGFAIEIVDEEEARKTRELFDELARLDETS
ncbi:MAG: HypC/HybG/HupF family hydrogenase formation chaperone [Actinomycetota bacterium]|nr:HypC/HybG/HupF family hydrogenase formation chaperone [Actinomycetota bacterium]